jgi:hypothetical protein
MSDELRWCNNFRHSVVLRGHKKKRVRKKNEKRVIRLRDYAFKRWGYFPYQPE